MLKNKDFFFSLECIYEDFFRFGTQLPSKWRVVTSQKNGVLNDTAMKMSRLTETRPFMFSKPKTTTSLEIITDLSY